MYSFCQLRARRALSLFNNVSLIEPELQKGAIDIDFTQKYSALLVLNGALLNSDKTLFLSQLMTYSFKGTQNGSGAFERRKDPPPKKKKKREKKIWCKKSKCVQNVNRCCVWHVHVHVCVHCTVGSIVFYAQNAFFFSFQDYILNKSSLQLQGTITFQKRWQTGYREKDAIHTCTIKADNVHLHFVLDVYLTEIFVYQGNRGFSFMDICELLM